ncbi:hypothetical protein DH86_00003877, partial [Scytalidium sp. 3C]
QFYTTNDHYALKGPIRYLEEKFGPWKGATNKVECRQVTGTFPGANGLALTKENVFVGDARNGTVTVYTRRSDNGLDFVKQIRYVFATHQTRKDLGAAADNIKVVPTNGDLIVNVFPTLLNLPSCLANVEKLGKELLVPAAALRLPKKNGYEPELFYRDDGSIISFMTAMTVDPYNKIAIGSSVLQYGSFAVCKLSDETVKKFIQ